MRARVKNQHLVGHAAHDRDRPRSQIPEISSPTVDIGPREPYLSDRWPETGPTSMKAAPKISHHDEATNSLIHHSDTTASNMHPKIMSTV